MADYRAFLQSACGPAWKGLGLARRAGVLAPLFSIQSKQSTGVGEFPDLELLADWCRECGMSLIQLLPLNDVGTRFCPYDAESSFALEPMYLALDRLSDIPAKKYAPEIAALRRRYPSGTPFFDIRVKNDKLSLLRTIFNERAKKDSKDFKAFKAAQEYWLPAYALFKVAKRKMEEHSWETWPEGLRTRRPAALRELTQGAEDEVEFHQWLQWQLFTQFRASADKVRKKKVRLVGDLPFLVARDSADVWAHPEYFKLNLSAGAPPDLYFAEGQEWGMPPYNWQNMAASGYDYLKEKLKFASNFYDLYRIDHFVGLFRVWVFPLDDEPDRKKRAYFDPPEESSWEGQARSILAAMSEATTMLPCAEDLGTVPDVARKLLADFAIPGMDVQRWMRDWEGTKDFTAPADYRPNAIATLSTHDMTSFLGWWRTEATEDDKERFRRFCGLPVPDPSAAELCRAAFEKAHESQAIFSVHSFQDWLTLAGDLGDAEAGLRINRPGLVAEDNWRLRMPKPLEKMLDRPSNKLIRKLNDKFHRE